MPRVARFKIAAVEDLLRQLEYAPAETRRRQMDAAERLIADIDPNQNYPQDFITFRITGYRPDAVDEPITFVGDLTGVQTLRLGGTSVLIVVGVVVETMKQLEAQLLQRSYEGFIR